MKFVYFAFAMVLNIGGAAAFAASDTSAPTQAPPPAPSVHVRGAIQKLENSVLTVKTREGGTASIRLSDDFGVTGVVKAKLSDIKADKFVGVAAKTMKDGSLQALEVLVFPDSMKGFAEGHYPWDLRPESTMTNATVANTVKNVKGQVLTLRYKDGEKKITVAKNAPIVTFVPADKSAVKPGAHVFINAAKQADGSLTAQRVTVGLKGVKPPM